MKKLKEKYFEESEEWCTLTKTKGEKPRSGPST